MRLTVIVALVLVAAVGGAAIAQVPAPAPRPTAPAPGAGGGRMGPPADMEQMLDQMLDTLATRLGLTAAEKAATKKAARAKMEATTAFSQQLQALGEVARNEKATDKELNAGLQKFGAALTAYRQRIKAIDAALTKAVSLRARVALTALGVIDNGMGMRGLGVGGGRGGNRMGGGFGAGRQQQQGSR